MFYIIIGLVLVGVGYYFYNKNNSNNDSSSGGSSSGSTGGSTSVGKDAGDGTTPKGTEPK